MSTKNLLMGLLLVAVFATGFMMGRFSLVGNSVGSIMTGKTDTVGTTGTTGTTSGAAGTTQTGTKINTSNLSDGQKALLKTLGVNTDTLVVTLEMVACAEASLGTARALEIKNGATPSFTEGVKLVACYK